ncbi:MAG: hypothetical protein AB1733_16265 [Thermodesulfobacteriota bacterium]
MQRRISVEQIVTHACKRYGLGLGVLAEPGKKRNCSEARAMIAALVWYEEHLCLTDLGGRLKRDVCSLSRADNRLHKRPETNARLASEPQRVREELAQIQIN